MIFPGIDPIFFCPLSVGWKIDRFRSFWCITDTSKYVYFSICQHIQTLFKWTIDIFILPAGYIRNFLKIFIACSLLVFPITSFLKIEIWKIANSHGFIFFLYYLSCFPVTFHFRRINKNRYKKQHDKCKNAQIESFFLTFFSYLLFYLSVHSVPLFPS